ncbi:MAG: glucosylceramidase [Verrucomicrobia bacterium Tous-C9LFEB]|nr:MAG: glucosylceramidase [Verrucomicrobia bacterium Tous-C9LFEB]
MNTNPENLHAEIYLTSRDTQSRLAHVGSVAMAPIPNDDLEKESIYIDPNITYQELEGFGGAFTESAAVTLQKMPEAKQQEILRAYFDPEQGLGYTLCRTHINSCDFSLGNYAYCEKENDFKLKSFSIDRDRQALLPMIHQAQKISRNGFKLFASPWSPPAWMKTNGKMNNGGKLKPDCREAWGRYYARYIREYAKEGVPIWGLTVQNEPMANQTWDSCLYTSQEEAEFIRDYLGPILEGEGLGHIKIIINDHNRDRMFERAKLIFDDPKASQYIWGTGFHWYGADQFENVQRVHDAWPDKKLLFTEGCQEGGPHIGSWMTGERYARSMIQDLNHWTVGWVDWNMILDEKGGPNHVGNYCSAPILADTTTHEIHYQSSYYYIGHFSRFIKPGAKRILATSTKDELEVTAFLNPEGCKAVVVLNRSERPIPFILKSEKRGAPLTLPARSILTSLL